MARSPNVKKITVSLPAALVDKIRGKVDAGEVASVSAYVSASVEDSMVSEARARAIEQADRLVGVDTSSPEYAEATRYWERQLGLMSGAEQGT